jgi:hypothetical protein
LIDPLIDSSPTTKRSLPSEKNTKMFDDFAVGDDVFVVSAGQEKHLPTCASKQNNGAYSSIRKALLPILILSFLFFVVYTRDMMTNGILQGGGERPQIAGSTSLPIGTRGNKITAATAEIKEVANDTNNKKPEGQNLPSIVSVTNDSLNHEMKVSSLPTKSNQSDLTEKDNDVVEPIGKETESVEYVPEDSIINQTTVESDDKYGAVDENEQEEDPN